MSLTLTFDELKAAAGYPAGRRPQARTLITWLRNNGFRYKIGLDTYPVVSRAHYEAVMGGAPRGSPRPELMSDR